MARISLEDLKKVASSEVVSFKIKNRQGYAVVCKENLTEGPTVSVAMERMNKALKRIGYTL